MHCWARYLFIVVVIALGTLSMIDACGQKGALYMPEPGADTAAGKRPKAPPPPAPTTGADVPTPSGQGAASATPKPP
jgi:predicted small lipoprotein YifL